MASILKAAKYEPASPEEHIRGVSVLLPVQDRCGFVFMLAYTKKETADSETFLQIMNDQVRRLADSFGKEANPQHRFEQFLGALNETLASQVRDGRWCVPIDQVHAVVGVATHQQMFLSGTGELTVLFFHRKPSQRYQIFNLFRGIQTEQALPTWEKTFAVVLDGDLHTDDVFCVCDKDLQREIAQEELNQILTTLPPVSAVEKIRQCFPYKEGLLLTLLKVSNSEPRATAQAHSAIPTSNVSIDAFEETADSTNKLLEDQRPRISSIVKFVVRWMKARAESKSRILQDINAKDTTINALKRFGRTLTRVLLFIGKLALRHTLSGWGKLWNKQERKKIVKRIQINGSRLQMGVRGLLSSAGRVPRSNKFLVLGIFIAAIVLVTGIAIMTKTQARAQEERSYQESVLTIEDLVERAAGAIIYQDEVQARSLYLNAQTLIENLQTNTPERANKVTELTSDIQVAMNEIRHLVTIPNPPLLADLAQLTDGVFGNSIVENSGLIYVLGSDGRVYSFNRAQKRFDVEISPESPVLSISASQEEGRYYFLGKNGEVYSLSIKDKLIKSAGVGDPRWVDLEAYANRLYLLRPTIDGTQGQIVRYDHTGDTFSKEHNWITSSTVSLERAVGLALDGSVYVLMRDGSIARFESGSEVGWNTGLVEPQLTTATKIWTSPESKFLYVLEPSTNRLAIFTKETGAFLVQYRSDAFTDLTDFVVDEKGYTIYLLAGSKLYSIAASHIE
jgi:hypothetical protein